MFSVGIIEIEPWHEMGWRSKAANLIFTQEVGEFSLKLFTEEYKDVAEYKSSFFTICMQPICLK